MNRTTLLFCFSMSGPFLIADIASRITANYHQHIKITEEAERRDHINFIKPLNDINTLLKYHRQREQELRQELLEAQEESLNGSTRSRTDILLELWTYISSYFTDDSELETNETSYTVSEQSLPDGVNSPDILTTPNTGQTSATKHSTEEEILEIPSFECPVTEDILSPLSPLPKPGVLSPCGRGQHFPIHHKLPPYTVIKELGRGGLGVVYLAEDCLTGLHFALKVLELKSLAHRKRGYVNPTLIEHETNKMMVEPKSLERLCGHPYIVKIIGYQQKDSQLQIAMEYAPGVNLSKIQLEETTVKEIMRQILLALQFSHSMGVAHLDIKPPNIIWDEERRKATLMDFGESRFFPTEDPNLAYHVSLGTIGYRKLGTDNVIEQDIYALGKTCEQILRKPANLQAQSFIQDCLDGKPIVDLIQHPWLRKKS